MSRWSLCLGFFLLSSGAFAQAALPAELSSARWYNDEYSLDVKDNGSYVMFFTFGDKSGDMKGSLSAVDAQTILVPLGKITGDFDVSAFGKGLKLKLLNRPEDVKATLSLASEDGNFILWNKKSFVPENQETTIAEVPVVTSGYKLSATTDNLRIRKGPGTSFDYQSYTYRDPQGKIRTFTSLLEGTNIRILARTRDKVQVQEWNNYWYYVEYKEPLGNLLVYKNAWCFGEFINQVASDDQKITITSPADEDSVYNQFQIDVTGTVTGKPTLLKLQIKNPFGNVIKEKVLTCKPDGSFTITLSKDDNNLFIGSNIVHFQARYSGNKMTQTQVTFYVHESVGEKAKPVIYLYPRTPTIVSVKVLPARGISKSDPPYRQGWTVLAGPDGKLADPVEGVSWPYLFWESPATGTYTGSEGFVVKSAELGKFFDEKLGILGLNAREIGDMKEYWLPLLSKAPWYRIYFYDQASIEREAPLIVDPRPDSVIRVYFDPRPLGAPVPVKEQALVPRVRTGFAVVEWGGARY
jgi:hypothetical protein